MVTIEGTFETTVTRKSGASLAGSFGDVTVERKVGGATSGFYNLIVARKVPSGTFDVSVNEVWGALAAHGSRTVKKERLYLHNGRMRGVAHLVRRGANLVPALPVAPTGPSVVKPPDSPTFPTGSTPVPTPTVAYKPFMGLTESNATNFNTMNALVGPVAAQRTYAGSTLPANWASSGVSSGDQAAGRISYFSWHPLYAGQAFDAAAQAAFSAFLDTIPAGAIVYLSPEHEPEDNIDHFNNNVTDANRFSLDTYGAMINAGGAIVHSKNRPNLKWGPTFQGVWTFDTRSPYDTLAWTSAFDLANIDFVGLDPYRTSNGTASTWEQMMTVGNSGTSSSVKSTMQTMIDWGKPVVLAEWGIFNKPNSDGSIQGTVITESQKIGFLHGCYSWMCAWNQAHLPGTPGHVDGAIYYNNTISTPPTDERLSTTAQQQAFAADVADSKIT